MQRSAEPALPAGLRGVRTARRGILGSSDGGCGGADEAHPTTPRERSRVALTESELATQEALVRILCSKVVSDIEMKFDGDSTIVIPNGATGATAAHASGGGSAGSSAGGSASSEAAFIGAAGGGVLRSNSEELPHAAALPTSTSGGAATAAPPTAPSSTVGAPSGRAGDGASTAAFVAASAACDDVLSAQRNFTVTALWSAQFAALRKLYLGGDAELAFIESLACCKPWRAKGGKSDAEFMKTLDDRFIMKMVNEKEIKAWQSKGKEFALS